MSATEQEQQVLNKGNMSEPDTRCHEDAYLTYLRQMTLAQDTEEVYRGMRDRDLVLLPTNEARGIGVDQITFDALSMFVHEGDMLVISSDRSNSGRRATKVFTADWAV